MKNCLRKIALLGTSADPPTYGHKNLLEGLTKLFPKVVTWASDNPIKKHGAPLDKRHKLLHALVESIDIPTLEVRQELSSPWTIHSIEKAIKYWPGSELVFVIGSDLTEQITTWVNADVLFKKMHIAIAPREGWPIQKQQLDHIQYMGGKVISLPLQIPKSASSDFRNKPNRSQIPESILPILIEQELYGVTTYQ